ncbi:hypothetical protein FACS1894217_13390 [Clostridia bacterium]|nr:hypothetical protein FACS1894217_13390 [Clostridia bacterium]
MGFLNWRSGRKDNHNQTANGNNNRQFQNNGTINMISSGPPGCRTNGRPSLGGCEGGGGCPNMWSCPIYSRYRDNISD